MTCPDIRGLMLDYSSRQALSDIDRITGLSRVLSNVMSYGVMSNILVGKGGLVSGPYNLSSTDFSALSKALSAIPAIQNKVIKKIAAFERLSHSGAQALFWGAMYDGCQ